MPEGLIRADISLRDGDSFSVLLPANFVEYWEEQPDPEWCSFALQRVEGSDDPDLILVVRKGDVSRIVREVGGEA